MEYQQVLYFKKLGAGEGGAKFHDQKNPKDWETLDLKKFKDFFTVRISRAFNMLIPVQLVGGHRIFVWNMNSHCEFPENSTECNISQKKKRY